MQPPLFRRANGGGKVPFEVVSETAMLSSPQKNGPGWQTRINNALKDWLQQHEH
jgi:uncharacterized protein (DUF4415 family)